MKKYFAILISLLLNCVSTIPAPSYSVYLNDNDMSKIGTSTYIEAFGFLKYGDGSLTKAMENSGIKYIHHVDIETTNYLILKKVKIIIVGSDHIGNDKPKELPDKDTLKNISTQQQNIPIKNETPPWMDGVDTILQDTTTHISVDTSSPWMKGVR